jgi:lipopolysaccharide assembly outer membrane protein LptD (OstA)
MTRAFLTGVTLVALLAAGLSLGAQAPKKLELLYADQTEFIFSKLQDTTFVTGSVVFQTETGMIYCDSSMWVKGEMAILWGKVTIDDKDYRLVADSVRYNLKDGRAVARGSYVELWSRDDSLFAVGTHAFFDRGREYFYMLERPTVYLNYPDTNRMIEVVGDYVEYDAQGGTAEAQGTVTISSKEFKSSSGCAVMHLDNRVLDLYDTPVISRKQSEIRGRFISIASDEKFIKRVDVIDSASGVFLESKPWSDTTYDRSRLSGRRILMDFIAGDLRSVTCYGQAYSWYNPASFSMGEQQENSVSGDTIKFLVNDEQLNQVQVVGGAVGTYLITKNTVHDSTIVTKTDTISYEADDISYSLIDSLITLKSRAKTRSGAVALEAYRIQFDTKERIIEAYSGSIKSDSANNDQFFGSNLQPNEVPVSLADGDQQLVGDYLRYSIDTEKGRIVKSKSNYQTGLFYGEQLHRQHKEIYYLENGKYTTCDADEPHFHFSSHNLKLIEGKRLIARPVVLNLGRLPILALPYYVFPLEKGRHSGILPFTMGNIERGERYVRNVGYYWAASQYWDVKGALDYYDENDRLNLYSGIAYNKLYAYSGSVAGNWGRETALDSHYREYRKTRWTLKMSHNQDFSPSFRVSASGDIRSDPLYYNDYSTDMAERLNRVVRSSINFTKKFGKSVSLSGTVSHDDQLDIKARTDHLPTMNISLPAIRPFGSGSIDETGTLKRRWYNELIVTYRPKLENFSSRVTKDLLGPVWYDTATNDSVTVITKHQDTTSYRSRKKYTRVDHSVSASFPLTVAKYFVLNPSMTYSENWVLIHETDQSKNLGIDASTTYRTFRYNAGTSLSTKLYGTVYPKLFGLQGLRQVIEPEISYDYSPKSDRHPVVSAYAGASARSSATSQELKFSLSHLYQAKLRLHDKEQSFELVSVTHSFSYDFEDEKRKFSDLSTTFRSNLLKNIRINADMVHSLYKSPKGDELDFWNPHLSSFQINTVASLKGKRFLFDEPALQTTRLGDSTVPGQPGGAPTRGTDLTPISSKGWDVSATYSYSESGKFSGVFKKSSALRLSLQFNLTPTTQVSYSQYYDIAKQKTVSNQVNIVKTLHCWTGTFHWVPTGSTRGWGFMLYVTALPAVKIDNSQSTLNSSYFQGL